MRKLIRTTLFTAVLLLFGVSTAPAQTFDLVADQADLQPDGGTADAHCIVQASNGNLVFFNSSEGGIYAWDSANGELIEHTSPVNLKENIGTTNNIDRCDAVAIDDNDFVYFSFRSTADNVNQIYRTDVSDPSTFSTTEINGINGLEAVGSTLYLAGVSEYGATRNGIFEISSDLSGDTTAVAANSNVDLQDASVEASSDGTLYGWSTGGGNFENVIVSLDPSASAPSFEVFTDPYGGDSPLTPDGGDQLGDLDIITFGGTEFMALFNNSYSGPNGPEFATLNLSDKTIELLFTGDDLQNNHPNNAAYGAGFTEPMVPNSSGEVYVTSTDAFGDTDYIMSVSDAPPLPVEMAGFDAVKNGSSVELTWETVSETNNAGFRVQHQAPGSDAWTRLDFVESKFDDGTTPEGASYRYTVNAELDVGTHRFRLQQKDIDGSTTPSKVVTLEKGLDGAMSLEAPAPNPAQGTTTLMFGVKEATDATVAVYNVLGQQVKTLYQGTPQPEQMTDVTFNAGTLPSGVYFVRLQADGQTQTERMTVVK